MNNTINEIKNSLEGINSRITEAEEPKNEIKQLESELRKTQNLKTKPKQCVN